MKWPRLSRALSVASIALVLLAVDAARQVAA